MPRPLRLLLLLTIPLAPQLLLLLSRPCLSLLLLLLLTIPLAPQLLLLLSRPCPSRLLRLRPPIRLAPLRLRLLMMILLAPQLRLLPIRLVPRLKRAQLRPIPLPSDPDANRVTTQSGRHSFPQHGTDADRSLRFLYAVQRLATDGSEPIRPSDRLHWLAVLPHEQQQWAT